MFPEGGEPRAEIYSAESTVAAPMEITRVQGELMEQAGDHRFADADDQPLP